MLTLWDFQFRAVIALTRALFNRPVLVCPTGGGKTVIAAELVRRLRAPALWVAHRRELIQQAAATLRGLGLDTGIIMAGVPPTPDAAVHVASIQTLARRRIPEVGLIVIDEAHHASADSYADLFSLTCPIIGLTATPFRLDGRSLGDMFRSIVVAAHCDELCASGVLHAPVVYASEPPDLSAVRTTLGDYNLADAAVAVNQPHLIGDIVRDWFRLAPSRKTVCFAINVKHSREIVAAFQAAGVAAENIDRYTPVKKRDAILDSLRSGETTIVSNCMVLTEGWDLPALECAIIARPTGSLNLHLQMIGRIMRAAGGKTRAIVVDHAGNHHRHGAVTRRIEYSLQAPVRATEAAGPLGLKRCANCGLMVPTLELVCPECGEVFPLRPREIRQEDGELVEWTDDDFNYRRVHWDSLRAEATAAGHSEGWAIHRFKERFGEFPVLMLDGGLCDTAHADADDKRAVYERFVAVATAKGLATGWASHRYRDAFGVWPTGFVKSVRAQALTERWESHK